MSPFFLFLLLVPLLSSSAHLCNERSTCLYFTVCYDEAKVEPNSFIMQPTANMTMNLTEAVDWKKSCDGFGFISILTIVSNDVSSMDITFETDLKRAGFLFRSTDFNYLSFNGSLASIKNGDNDIQTMEPSSPVELLGRVLHRMQVTSPNKKPLGSLFDSKISIQRGEKRIFTDDNDIFWKHVQENLACNGEIIHDSCNDTTECHKLIIDSHSARCSQPGLLQLNISVEWRALSSVSCRNSTWTLVKVDKTELTVHSKSIDLRCAIPTPNTTVAPLPTEETESLTEEIENASNTTVAPLPTEETESLTQEIENASSTTPSIDEFEEPLNGTRDIAPNAQLAGDPLIAATEATAKNKEEGFYLPGSKWIWIGSGAALLTLLTVGNIGVCFYCYRNKNGTKQSKDSKMGKKKGGKPQTDSASSGKQSCSEGKTPAKQLKSDKPVHSSEQTEMLLDRLKTERIN